MVSDVTIGTALEQQSKTAVASSQLSEDFSDFLNLLTVQLQNQDPLDPMDTSEFTNQIVAFTGVEQQINTNQKLDSLVSLQLNNALSGALNYVGLDISYVGSEFYYDGTIPSDMNYALANEANDVTLRIVDENGDIVYEEDGQTELGNNEFTWDGTNMAGDPMPAGTYRLRIDALDYDGNAVTSTAVVSGNVRGIETQNGQLFALVGDRAVALSNILNAEQPASAPTETETEEPST